MAQINVADISRWQGTVDWDLFSKNIDAVIIKATGADGGALYTDGMLARNRDEARRTNTPRWFYHYKGAGVSARDQAAYMLNAIGLQAGEGIVLDDENEGKVNPGFNAEFTDAVKELSGGLINVAYSNLSRFQGVDLSPIKSRNVGAWVAKYGQNTGTIEGAGAAPSGIDLPIIAWQYTSVARKAGVSANTVDMNIFYGDVEAFKAYGAKGNVPTVSAPAASVPVAEGSGTYTVVAKDTLSGIGAKLGISWQNIAATNGIVSPYVIFPGQVLKVYGGTMSQTVTAGGSTYMVVSNDTLSGIGTKTGHSWADIASLNNIKAPYIIYPGQTLQLPGGAITQAASNVPTYTVRSGDYLSTIGPRVGVDWKQIAVLNGIAAPYVIYPNQVLKLA